MCLCHMFVLGIVRGILKISVLCCLALYYILSKWVSLFGLFYVYTILVKDSVMSLVSIDKLSIVLGFLILPGKYLVVVPGLVGLWGSCERVYMYGWIVCDW